MVRGSRLLVLGRMYAEVTLMASDACGSDPTDGSDVNNGELTLNWVIHPSEKIVDK